MNFTYIIIALGTTSLILLATTIFLFSKNKKKSTYISKLEKHVESKIKLTSKKLETMQNKLNNEFTEITNKANNIKIVKSQKKTCKVDNAMPGDFDMLDSQILAFEKGLKKLKEDK